MIPTRHNNILDVCNCINKKNYKSRNAALDDLKSMMRCINIDVVWNSENILLSSNDSDSLHEFKNNIFREANGVILKIEYCDFWTIRPIEYKTFPKTTYRVSSPYQIRNLNSSHNYKCYKIKDGSIFHSYYNLEQGRWNIFTKRNIDIQEDDPPFPFKESTIIKVREYLETVDKDLMQHFIVSDPDIHKLCKSFNISDINSDEITFAEAIRIISDVDSHLDELGIVFRSDKNDCYSNILCEFPAYRIARQMFYVNNLEISNEHLVKIYRSSRYKKEIRKIFPSYADIFTNETDEDREKIEDICNFYINKSPTSYPELVYAINLELNIKNISDKDKIKERVTKYVINGR